MEKGNSFVDYLNSMNNANSKNENALAESQITSEYYEYIKVNRKISDILFNKLNESPKGIILTGHAGDGKTSILAQILDKYGYFENKNELEESDTLKDKIFYIKDMSELSKSKQKTALEEFLKSPKKNNISSILISNTGPLINTFRQLLGKDKFSDLESEIIESLDTNDFKKIIVNIDVEEYEFYVVNIAILENIYLSKEIFNNILNEKLWDKCEHCEIRKKCPIYTNYKNCKLNEERISKFIEALYTWFKYNESRLTIRQMLSHLSFSITANLTCKDIYENNYSLYDYAFPNLFFGYCGTEYIKDSTNIKAIKELNKISIDKKTLPIDIEKKLFSEEDFSVFDEPISEIISNYIDMEQKNVEAYNSERNNIRCSIRRFYMLASNNYNNYEDMIKNIFSDSFLLFLNMSKEEILSPKEKKWLKDIIFNSLFRLFTGVYSKNNEILYLTVRKNMDDIQNVQIITGELSKSDILIKHSHVTKEIEEFKDNYTTNLKFGRIDELYEINYPMLNFMVQTCEGEVFTLLNPTLTFGINKIKSDLMNKYKNIDEDTVDILIIRKNSIEKEKLEINKDGIEVL